jgi:chromosome segregation ATPase
MTEQEHLECEIKEYQIELQQHEEAIERLKVRIEQKEKELEKMKPPTLYKTLLQKTEYYPKVCGEICDVVEEWISKYECDYVTCEEHLKGYNALKETLNYYIRPPQELDPKNLPYFVGN